MKTERGRFSDICKVRFRIVAPPAQEYLCVSNSMKGCGQEAFLFLQKTSVRENGGLLRKRKLA